MRPGTRLVAAASLLLVLTMVLRANDQGPQALKPSSPTVGAQAVSSEYLGSQSCAKCHDVEHTQWKNSLHIKMTKPVAEATIVGDFREGTTFSDHGRSYTFNMKNGTPVVTVSFGGRVPETFAVDYTLGAKRYQGYLSMLPEGRIYVLPVFWHIASKRWVDWKEITPIPDGAHDLRQIWNANCFNCHGTNIVQGYDINDKRYRSTWTEMGIGCEACHGPGREHVALMEEWEKNPASKPKYDNSSKNRGLSDTLKIFSTRSSEPRRIYDTCAYCHGNKTNVFVGFKGGDRFADFATPLLMSAPIPDHDPQGEFWPDGRPNRFNRPQALSLSGCFKAGAVTCTSCHVAHGSRNEHSLKVNIYQGRNGDALCTQCHTQTAFAGATLKQHTFHAPESAGSRCINCHMSDVNWRLLVRRRDHTFQPPVPENTAEFGIPNACNTCHDDRSPEWAARQMDAWWGDRQRRAGEMALADTMYRAGSGDAATLTALSRLAVDRTRGFLIRASAADYVGRLISEARSGNAARSASTQSQTSFDGPPRAPSARSNPRRSAAVVTPAIVNAMIGAAADPEPAVRAAAVRTLGIIGDRDRTLGAVLARLIDPTRVVRARAAEILESFGVVELPGPAGDTLRIAQQELVTALRSFPDTASLQTSLAWFELQRGNLASAHEAVDAALRVAPSYTYAWVVKGVLLTRDGKFTEAVEMWKKARSIEPSYPNIDQLIAEAEKRK